MFKKTGKVQINIVLTVLFVALTVFAGTNRTVRVSFYESRGCHEIAKDGTRSGYGYDFMEELAAKAGWKVEYVGYDWPWDKVLENLEKGEIDLVDFVTHKPERESKMIFSKRPMSYTGCAIRTFPDRVDRFNMATIAKWGHVRVGVMSGDVTAQEFRDFAEDYRLDYEMHEYETEEEGVEAMRRGELDLVAFEELVSFPELVVIEICKPFTDHVVTRRDNPALMAEIDAAMSAMDRDDPGWMTRIHQKYFPTPTVYAYLPANGRKFGPTLDYLRTLLSHLDEVLARNIEIRECSPDFSDADFTVPSFACGVTFTSEGSERFRFPLQAAGSRRADLFALSGRVDQVRAKMRDADKGPVRIGCLEREWNDFRRILEQYAIRNSLAYEPVPCKSVEELRRAVAEGKVELLLRPSGLEKEYTMIDSCGFIDFFLAPTSDHAELLAVIDKAFKYLRLDDPQYLLDLEKRYFGIDSDKERLVTLGAYVESGLSVRRADGSFDGIVTDFVSEIARRSGWYLKIVPLSFTEAQRALAEGTVDVMGAAVWTESRSRIYDYSKFDMGPLYYALMKRSDGRMKENRPDTWNNVKIAFQRGSLSIKDLEKFLAGYGIRWEGVPFNNLDEAEKFVREGTIDAVYTLAHEDNRDLVPLVMLPTRLCYFCSNKRKPWIKKEMDSVTEELLRENHRWISDIYERHLATSRGVLQLSADEIDFVRGHRGSPLRISFLDEIDPEVSRDPKTGEITGFFRMIFDRIAERTGLEFEYSTGNRPADITLRVDGAGDDRPQDLCDPSWYKLPVCRVRRREVVPSAKGTVAIMKSRSSEIELARKAGSRPVILETREDCYQAVMDGQVEYMVDNFSVATKLIDVEKRYDGLYCQRADMAELSRPVAIYCSTTTDPRLRSILDKARDSLSSNDLDLMLFGVLYGEGHPLSMKVKSILFTALIIILVVLVLYFLTHQHLRVARQASKAKTDFLFNMSHDIRTPMNAIMGFSDIALKNLDNIQLVKSSVEKAREAGGLLLSIINSILDMSRIESGHAKIEEVEANILRSFDSIETTMRSFACEKRIDLSFEYGNIKNPYVYADRERCVRVFVNLISNAIKYTQNGGWVRVKCEEVGVKSGSGTKEDKNSNVHCPTPTSHSHYATYRFTFEDNGIGMSEEFQKHVFEEFARERNATSSGIQGTGLGLALCKSFIELMGGTISCKSKQGVGTTFTVEIPFRVREEGKSKDEKVKSADGKDLKNENSSLFHLSPLLFTSKRVLLVEDNELNREVATYLLKEQGLEVESAEDGSIAVRLVKEKGLDYYDFILMDIQMPIMGGYEATRMIREFEKSAIHNSSSIVHRLPIIALSANAFAEDKAASIAAGMDDHVAKPIKINELLSVLAKHLNRSVKEVH